MFVEVKHDHAGWRQRVASMNEASGWTKLRLEFKKLHRKKEVRDSVHHCVHSACKPSSFTPGSTLETSPLMRQSNSLYFGGWPVE